MPANAFVYAAWHNPLYDLFNQAFSAYLLWSTDKPISFINTAFENEVYHFHRNHTINYLTNKPQSSVVQEMFSYNKY